MRRKNTQIMLTVLLFGIVGNLSLAQSFLDVNNVKAMINYEGSFFWDYKTQTSYFEVPKGSTKSTIFASTLWIGGYDAGNNLREAAQTYRQKGTDFWAGPLDTINLTTDTAGWQRTWKVNKSIIDNHRKNYNKSGYNIPLEIQNWPANGTGSHQKVLAPFVDVNSNQQYDPESGDFPYIFGDQAVYFIMNDNFSLHGETNGMPMGIEIHTMSYAFNSFINGVSMENTIFVRYEIKNCSKMDYMKVYAGIWTDFDIGYGYDDYIGCDSTRNMYFGFNGDSLDNLPYGYGLNPPVQAVKFLSHPMSHFVYYDNDFSLKGNPSDNIHYYYYLDGKFKNGQKMRYGGDGYNKVWDAAKFANYIFPSNPKLARPNWNEISSGNSPGDRRGLGSIGPLNFKAGEVLTLDIAYIFVKEPHTNYLDVFDDLNSDADQIQQLYDQGKITNPYQTNINDKSTKVVMNIVPNPMDNYTVISFKNHAKAAFNIQITDLYGKIIFQKSDIKSNEIRITGDEIKAGFYVVTLSNENSQGQMKLIKR